MAHIEKRQSKKHGTRFRAQVRMKGHPVVNATFGRLTDARRWISDTESAIREGRYFKTTAARNHTLGEAVDRFKADPAHTALKNRVQQARHLDWWRNELGAYTLADVTADRIAECRDKLLREPTAHGATRANATIVRYLAALSHLFTVTRKEWRWTTENPVLDVTKPREPRGRVRFLSDDERKNLLDACTESRNPYLYTVVVIALSTGMRQGEILGLKWADVDFQRGRLTLHDTKNGERRGVPLVGFAATTLEQFAKVRRLDSPYVFPSRKRGPNATGPAFPRNAWEAALKRAGIADFRFHDLRHSTASYLAMNGASLAEIAEVLGHKTLAMVKRYSHLSEGHTSRVVERMTARIF